MAKLAVLLRAINVGGTGKLAMADFKTLLAELGYAEPKTLGAAGSAIIETAAKAESVETKIAAEVKSRFGLTTEVFVRTHAELTAILKRDPFPKMAKAEPGHLVVAFLDGEPTAAGLKALREKIVGPEEAEIGPRCLYVAYGEGMGHSKLTGAIIDRALGRRGTARNWNTVTKLAELTA